jgi:DNA repair protein RecO (recombination protein O)
MIDQQAEAIILHTQDYGESDRLITFYARQGGKLKGIAKGARRSRKRFVNTFELFSIVELAYKERKSLVWIDSCKLLEPHLELRSELHRWGYAALATEIMLEMIPEADPDIELFLLLKDILSRLTQGKDPQNLALLFLIRFLDITGYLPALENCSVCRRPLRAATRWDWHLSRGDLLCPEHCLRKESVTLDLGTLLLIQQLRRLPLHKIWRLHLLQDKKSMLFNSLIEWICGQIRKDLNSLKLLEQISSAQHSP